MKKEVDRDSPGQQTAVFRLAALAVAVSVLPRIVARQAGRAGWLAPVLAAPVLWAVVWVFCRLTERGRRSYAAVCRERLGVAASSALYIIYIVWGLAMAGAVLRLSGQRILWTGGTGSGLGLIPVLAAAAAWLAWGKAAVFGRAAVLLCRGVEICLLLVLVLTLSQVRQINLLPVWVEDALPVARAGGAALGVVCCGLYTAFLPTRGLTGGVTAWGLRCTALCLLLVATLAVVLGTQGAELTALLADPFLALSRHAGVEGAFQRVESLVSAAWLPADLVLLGMVYCACRTLLGALWPVLDRQETLFVPAAVVPAVSVLCFRDAAVARTFCERWLPVGSLILFAVIPAFVLFGSGRAHLVAKSRKTG